MLKKIFKLTTNTLGFIRKTINKFLKKTLKYTFKFFNYTIDLLFGSKPKKKKKGKGDWKETFKLLFSALIIAVMIRSFLYEPFHIPSGSMKPGLLNGDFIFVSKYSYGYSRYSFPFGPPLFKGRAMKRIPERGDVVVFKLPKNPRVNYIKRLIGFPGDKIQMRKGVLYVNNREVAKKYGGRYMEKGAYNNTRKYLETLPNGKQYFVLDTKRGTSGDDTPVFTVPEKHYFLMGDNRDNSLDSRFREGTGYVPEENLVGEAQIIFLSSKENPLKFWKWFKIIRIKRILKKIK